MQKKSILLSSGLVALMGATGGALRSQDAAPTSPDSDRARHKSRSCGDSIRLNYAIRPSMALTQPEMNSLRATSSR